MKKPSRQQKRIKKAILFLLFFGAVFFLSQQTFAQNEKVMEKIAQLGLPDSTIYQIVYAFCSGFCKFLLSWR